MKYLVFVFLWIPFVCISQFVHYTPNRKIEKTVSKTYYDTEFIFLKTSSTHPVSLQFELLEDALKAEWSATICTNSTCYSSLPKSGNLGTIDEENEAYFSFNFAANKTIGKGQVRYLITSPEQPELSDTITFRYSVTEDGTIKAGPWAKINQSPGVLTILLENPNNNTSLQVYNMRGELLVNTNLKGITSFPLRDYPKGIYFVIIRDENDRILKKKIVNY